MLASLATVAVFIGTTPAFGHHILGIPHYAYEDDYPQTPVLTYAVEAAHYDVKVTGYPGELEPGDRCSLYVYVTDKASGLPFDGSVGLTVFKKNMIRADEPVYGPLTADLDESVYKFYPQFDAEAEYLAELSFGDPDHPWVVDLPMVVGEPASPWVSLAVAAVGMAIAGVVLRAVMIKRRRSARRRRRAESMQTARQDSGEPLRRATGS
jgi:hypothetical protein